MTTIIASSLDTTPWAALISEVAPHAPECPQPIIQAALVQAAREFFSDSRCWRRRGLTLLTTVAGQEAYDFSPPANAELLQVHACWDGEDEVDAELPGEGDDWFPSETSTTYRVSVSNNGAQIELRPAPSASGTVLKGSVSYTLSPNATAIPTWIFNEHRYGLVCGAAARLIIQPKKPWTNPQAYGVHRGEFEKCLRAASNQAGPIRRKSLRVKPWG